MSMRKGASAASILVLVSLLSLSLTAAAPAHAARPSTPGPVDIVISTTMIPFYDIYGSGANHVVATVNSTLYTNSPIPLEIIASFRPTSVAGFAVVNGTDVPIPVAVSSGRFATFFALDFNLPANTTGFSVRLAGSQAGYSFLWRYIANVPSVVMRGSPALTGSTRTTLVTLPEGTDFAGTFFNNGTQITTPYSTLLSTSGGSEQFSVAGYVGTIMLQSKWFVPGSILVASLGAIAFALASLNAFGVGRRWIRRLIGGPASRIRAFAVGGGRSVFSAVRGLLARTRGLFQPKKLLSLFILCAILMVGIGAIAGPYPSDKAYVVAAPGSVGQIHNNLLSFDSNIAVLTPSQDYSDFAVMSSVGDFNIAVISDYPSLAVPSISGFILSGLANVPVIVMDNRTDPTFANQINALYGDRVIPVQNAGNLTQADKQLIAEQLASTARLRVLGLDLSGTGFKLVLAAEGALSFVLIFLGWAFLGSLVSEARLRSGLYQLATVVSSGVFVFLFSETIYVTTSLLLAFPLSLHAVISGAKDVTAVGYLGFGGGSTPRLAAGFAGVLLGVGLTEGAPKIQKTDLAIILGFILFVLADPLYLGQFVYQSLLLFVGNFAFGSAFTSSQSLKGFIYGVGSVFGGSINPTYLMSAGKMLYFAGLVPLAYIGRMGRTTTALAVLLCALLIGDGGVRVGEMTPDKTVVAVVPGLFVGFAFLVIVLGLAAGEKYIRRGRDQ